MITVCCLLTLPPRLRLVPHIEHSYLKLSTSKPPKVLLLIYKSYIIIIISVILYLYHYIIGFLVHVRGMFFVKSY